MLSAGVFLCDVFFFLYSNQTVNKIYSLPKSRRNRINVSYKYCRKNKQIACSFLYLFPRVGNINWYFVETKPTFFADDYFNAYSVYTSFSSPLILIILLYIYCDMMWYNMIFFSFQGLWIVMRTEGENTAIRRSTFSVNEYEMRRPSTKDAATLCI